MAIGSRRTSPTLPTAAAVRSEATVAPTNTPWFQSSDSNTSGARRSRRPPKMMAEIGTPFGSSQFLAIDGHWPAGAVKRLFGCAPWSGLPSLSLNSGFHGLPSQLVPDAGGAPSPSSHHTVRSSPRRTFVKMVFFWIVLIAFGLDFVFVPGATPKKPASGLQAHR